MQWWEWLVGILLFIVALGVLIGVHELGHLAAAKAFNVYCFNYSIGFGPKIFSTKRTPKHETIWSLRAIPLGGFVAMYGEGAEIEGTEYIPPSRSLEGIARYKRAIIISAGVFLNFVLGFVLIFLHNSCFDQIYFQFPYSSNSYDTAIVVSTNESATSGVKTNDALKLMPDPLTNVYVIQDNVAIPGSDTTYCLCFNNSLSQTKNDPLVSSQLLFYKQIEINTIINEKLSSYTDEYLAQICYKNKYTYPTSSYKEILSIFKNEKNKDKKNEIFKTELNLYYQRLGLNHSIDVANGKYNVDKNTPEELSITLPFATYDESLPNHYKDEINYVNTTLKLNNNKNGWNDLGIGLKRYYFHYNVAESFEASWSEWCSSNTAIFRALGNIFVNGGKDVGGIITIASQSSQVLSNFGIERYLFLWGTISCNLAIINLLPFPALDGWALVVIAYEGITKKQIPSKVKNIISVVGFILLAALMVLILVKDIVRLI